VALLPRQNSRCIEMKERYFQINALLDTQRLFHLYFWIADGDEKCHAGIDGIVNENGWFRRPKRPKKEE